jgi:chromosomal replication initiation ATPase DnaA
VTQARQLAFPFPQRDQYGAADFIHAPSNDEALAWLARPSSWPGGRLSVFGPYGAGKTHLLHLFAERHGAILLPGGAVRRLPDLPDSGGIAVDDADAAPEPEALLHLLNAAAERRLPVLLAGRTPPARWEVTLPDLDSRLRAIATVGLGQPDDALLRALLARLLADRQLRVDSAVQEYLLARLPRHGAALREAASCLDRLSLGSGRAISRAVAAELLQRLNGECFENGASQPVPPSPEASVLL